MAWAVALGCAVVLFPQVKSSDHENARPAAPTFQLVGKRETSLRTSVHATVEFGETIRPGSAATGILTEISVRANQNISAGERLWQIDGVSVLAYVSSTPLWRDISIGDRGSDVRALSQFLVNLGLLRRSSIKADYGSEQQGAVRKLQKRIGVQPDGIFRMRYVIYIQQNRSVVNQVLADLGDRIAEDMPIIEVRGDVQDVRIEADDKSTLTQLSGRGVVLESESGKASFDTFPISREDFARLFEFLGTIPVAGAGDDSSLVSFDGLAIELRTPLRVATVPAGAVYTDEAGVSCVFKRARHSDVSASRFEPLEVQIEPYHSTELGIAYLPAGLSGSRVLSNPYALNGGVRLKCS